MPDTNKELRLQRSLTVLADAITYHGDQYWPLYEMVDKELSRMKKARKKIAKMRNQPVKYG